MRSIALSETVAVGQYIGLLPANANDQVQRQRCKARDRSQHFAIPMIGWVRRQVGRRCHTGRQPFERIRDAAESVVTQAAIPSASST